MCILLTFYMAYNVEGRLRLVCNNLSKDQQMFNKIYLKLNWHMVLFSQKQKQKKKRNMILPTSPIFYLLMFFPSMTYNKILV